MRIIAYLRVSTKHQVESSQSLEHQRITCEKYARDKGKVIEKFYVDMALSGTKSIDKRPGLSLLLDEMQKGDMLLVSARDRLAREVGVMEKIKDRVKEKKGKIISCAGEGTESEDEYDLTAITAYTASDFMSRMEQALAKVRVKRALDKKKANNERLGVIPYGMMTQEDGIHLCINPEEQLVLEEIRKLRENGYTILETCEEMNKRKLFNRDGRPWKKSALHRKFSR